MNKDKLTSFQFSCLICFPILAFFSGIGTYNIIKTAQVDAYLSTIFACLFGIIVLLLFFYIFNYKPNLNIIEKNKYLFGKVLGTALNYLINILVLLIGVALIYNIGNFAISQFLSETPLLIFMILFSLVLIYNVHLGIKNISRVGIIFFSIVCFLTIISTLGVIPTIDFSNLNPFLEHGLTKPIQGGFTLTLINVIPIFTLLIVEKEQISDHHKITKKAFFFYAIAFLFTFLAIFLTLSSLGIHLSEIYQYPEYTVLKKISIFHFVDRIENFIYIKWVLNSFMCLSLIIYYISHSVQKQCKLRVPIIVSVIIIYLALTIFKNNTFFYYFSYSILPYCNLLLFFIFVIIAINIFIRKLLET